MKDLGRHGGETGEEMLCGRDHHDLLPRQVDAELLEGVRMKRLRPIGVQDQIQVLAIGGADPDRPDQEPSSRTTRLRIVPSGGGQCKNKMLSPNDVAVGDRIKAMPEEYNGRHRGDAVVAYDDLDPWRLLDIKTRPKFGRLPCAKWCQLALSSAWACARTSSAMRDGRRASRSS
ncbi:MAG: hypothetical protein O2967_18485 [Proteobacteria bacterium]|nr:hypothetical protein [Pseudomonadota bacterium]